LRRQHRADIDLIAATPMGWHVKNDGYVRANPMRSSVEIRAHHRHLVDVLGGRLHTEAS
jgi:hypothetical protein